MQREKSHLVMLVASVFALSVCGPAVADPPASTPSVPTTDQSQVIPAGTLVAIRVAQNLSSASSKRGDKFPISLMNDIWMGDKIVVPMGTEGIGEVIHASGKGFGGRAGELIVTARYLDFNGRQIRLGHFKLSSAGANNATVAMIATTAAPIIGVFVTGTSAYIGAGQLAQAKVAEDFRLEIPEILNTEEGSTVTKGGN